LKRRATVLRVTAGSTPGGADFALVRLDDGTGPASLGLGTTIEKLATVVAAGYPGLAIRSDPEFARLLAGDGTAAPDLNFTQGAVQSLTQRPGNPSLIVHSASTLKGNSGGPLVDMCGRVVGVNTFIALDEKQAGRLSYALGAEALLAFLREAAGAAQGDSRPCTS
jgi:S1-C subfamily serine protease